MRFLVEIPDLKREISPVEVSSFIFTADIFSLYSSCEIIIKDFCQQTFNIIKAGMDINVIFEDNTISYVNKMKVLAFTKVPGNQSTLTDYLKLNLVPAFYYKSAVLTAAYQGSIKNIIQDVVSTHFEIDTDFSDTDDASKVRYQTGEKSQDFINRITKFGIKGNMPVYLYMDAKNCLNLKGISEFTNKAPLHVLETMYVERSKDIPADDVSKDKLQILDYKFSNNGVDLSSKLTTKFTTSAFVSSKKFSDRVILSNSENNNDQTDTPTSEKTVFKSWNLTPDDALAISVRESFESNAKAYYVICLCRGIVDFNGTQPGDALKVLIPQINPVVGLSGQSKVLGEGVYIIQKVEYLLQENQQYTRFTLLQAKY